MSSKPKVDLRGVVRAAMEVHGLSIAETARRAKMTAANLSDWLAGKSEIRSDAVERLLEVLGVVASVKTLALAIEDITKSFALLATQMRGLERFQRVWEAEEREERVRGRKAHAQREAR